MCGEWVLESKEGAGLTVSGASVVTERCRGKLAVAGGEGSEIIEGR